MLPAARRACGALTLVAACVAPVQAQKVSPVRPGARVTTRGPAPAAPLTASERSALVRLLAAEDERGLGAAGVAPLFAALRDPSPVVRRAAVRGLGRLQRPALLDSIDRALADPDARVRVEAANAIGQALQGLRSADVTPEVRRGALDEGVDALVRAAERHPDPALLAVAARTLGRLPYADSVVPREVERVMVQMGERPVASAGARSGAGARGGAGAGAGVGAASRALMRSDAEVATGILHGLYNLARASRATGRPSPGALAAMRSATTFGLEGSPPVVGGNAEANARVRRLAYLGLAAAGDTSSALVQRALADADEQVRRLAVVSATALRDSATRNAVLTSALRDPSFLVRFEAVRSHRALATPRSCAPLLRAVGDVNPHVRLAAIDALGMGCAEREAALDTLRRLIETSPATGTTRVRGGTSWHVHAHALSALARLDAASAVPLLRRDARHPVWQVRLYVARAATAVRDTLTLTALAYDTNGNVREAALTGIAATVGHAADRVFTAALASSDYQVVMSAANALKGAPLPDSVAPALLAALERLTLEQRENSRDPRMALLERLAELGSARLAPRLASFTTDFDSTVAVRAATIMERWTLRRSVAAPRRLAPPADPVADVIGGELRLLVRMSPASGGGLFVIRLLPDEAPATVARLVKLARAGYYAGLSFHRVEPTFVIQGGSPGATEYVGDGPFMRDEVGLPSHLRGTLGISTRGRDTGDAQLFVNLTDNFRLDHDYTVFGEIIQGREVAEGVIEGDVIERVDVVRVR
jgi:cyclophilin family peptidyl-prolyl cis-trans isomerase/HEAT repeat protein